MKRGTIRHQKIYSLARLLHVHKAEAVGVLTALWETASDLYPSGDLTGIDPDYLAEQCLWEGAGADLLASLEAAKLIDRLEGDRLYIHDWHEHCEYTVHNKLARAGRLFGNGLKPTFCRLNASERRAAEAAYADPESTAHARRTHGARTKNALPLPLPSASASASA